MDRRRFLAASATVVLAGCGNPGDGDGEDPYDIDDPERVRRRTDPG